MAVISQAKNKNVGHDFWNVPDFIIIILLLLLLLFGIFLKFLTDFLEF